MSYPIPPMVVMDGIKGGTINNLQGAQISRQNKKQVKKECKERLPQKAASAYCWLHNLIFLS